jgi:hypothetical protein
MSLDPGFGLQGRLLPTVPPDLHEIALLVREADFFFLPEAYLFAVASQSVNTIISKMCHRRPHYHACMQLTTRYPP